MKEEKTPLQLEIIEIWEQIKAHDEVREVGVKLISKLKSEVEGRGAVPKLELDNRRKVFKTLLAVCEE